MTDIVKPSEKPRWATDVLAAVTTPPLSKQDIGWIVEYPPHQFFNWLAKTTYEWINYFESKGDTDLGGAAETTLTIASGVITPTSAGHSIDTEGGAASDDLANIVTTNLQDGRLILVRCVSASRVITIKHNAGGSGQIALTAGIDLILADPSEFVLLKRTGANWEQVFTSQVGSDITPFLGGNLDVKTRKIYSTTTNGDIVIEPNGIGSLAPETTGKALGKVAARWNIFGSDANLSGTLNTNTIDTPNTSETLNIGNTRATTINIGRVGATIAFYGSVTEVHTTNTYVSDKLVTLNDGGLVSTGGDVGIEVEEAATITGYVKTASNRNKWSFKSPSSAEIISIGTEAVVVGDIGIVSNEYRSMFSGYTFLNSAGSIIFKVQNDSLTSIGKKVYNGEHRLNGTLGFYNDGSGSDASIKFYVTDSLGDSGALRWSISNYFGGGNTLSIGNTTSDCFQMTQSGSVRIGYLTGAIASHAAFGNLADYVLKIENKSTDASTHGLLVTNNSSTSARIFSCAYASTERFGVTGQGDILFADLGSIASTTGATVFGRTPAVGIKHLFNIGTSGDSRDFAAASGTIQFCNVTGTNPAIIGKTTAVDSAFTIYATTNNSNTGKDFVFDVRESDGTAFATNTGSGFGWARAGTFISSLDRAGQFTIGENIGASTASYEHKAYGHFGIHSDGSVIEAQYKCYRTGTNGATPVLKWSLGNNYAGGTDVFRVVSATKTALELAQSGAAIVGDATGASTGGYEHKAYGHFGIHSDGINIDAAYKCYRTGTNGASPTLKWSLGNNYAGGTDVFRIYSATKTALELAQSGAAIIGDATGASTASYEHKAYGNFGLHADGSNLDANLKYYVTGTNGASPVMKWAIGNYYNGGNNRLLFATASIFVMELHQDGSAIIGPAAGATASHLMWSSAADFAFKIENLASAGASNQGLRVNINTNTSARILSCLYAGTERFAVHGNGNIFIPSFAGGGTRALQVDNSGQVIAV